MNLDIYKNRFDNPKDFEILIKTQQNAIKLYQGIKRKDGFTDYINHPENVVQQLIALNITDIKILITAYYHDVLEENHKINDKQLYEIIKEDIEDSAKAKQIIRDIKLLTFKDDIFSDKEEKTYQKALYLSRFINKPDLLLIKTIDRLSNVREFYEANNKYAKKYFTRGEILYGACFEFKNKYNKLNDLALFINIPTNKYSMYFNNVCSLIKNTKKNVNK